MDTVLPLALVQAHNHLSLALQESIRRGAVWNSQEIRHAGRAFAYAFVQEPARLAELERRARLVESRTAPDTPFDRAKCQGLLTLTRLPRSCLPTGLANESEAFWKVMHTFQVASEDLSAELAAWGKEYYMMLHHDLPEPPVATGGEVQPPPRPAFTMTGQLTPVVEVLRTLAAAGALPDQVRAILQHRRAEGQAIIDEATLLSADGCRLLWHLLHASEADPPRGSEAVDSFLDCGRLARFVLGDIDQAAGRLVEWAWIPAARDLLRGQEDQALGEIGRLVRTGFLEHLKKLCPEEWPEWHLLTLRKIMQYREPEGVYMRILQYEDSRFQGRVGATASIGGDPRVGG